MFLQYLFFISIIIFYIFIGFILLCAIIDTNIFEHNMFKYIPNTVITRLIFFILWPVCFIIGINYILIYSLFTLIKTGKI